MTTEPRGPIRDSEVGLLASIAGTLRDDYMKSAEADPWSDSPFKWIKTRPSRQVGKIGEQLVAGWCAAKGFDVTKSGDSEADRVIAGKRVEIKFSTLWKSGVFKFQQLRDQNYEYAICLGISPFDAQCWAISKETLLRHVIGVTPRTKVRQGVTRSGCLSEPLHPLVGLTSAVAASPMSMASSAIGSRYPTTFPGFMIPCGSSAAFTARIAARPAAPNSSRR